MFNVENQLHYLIKMKINTYIDNMRNILADARNIISG